MAVTLEILVIPSVAAILFLGSRRFLIVSDF